MIVKRNIKHRRVLYFFTQNLSFLIDAYGISIFNGILLYACIRNVNTIFKKKRERLCLRMTMTSTEPEDILRGKTLDVYRHVLKNRKPTGVREVQRALRLSSPRLAFYHLNKLEEAGFLKKTVDGYVVDRVFLLNSIRLKRLLIPRYIFYLIFFITAIAIELTVFRPPVLRGEYVFGLVVIFAAVISFLYETIRIILKKSL